MPNDGRTRIEVITGLARRRYWPAHEKLRIVEERLVPGESSSTAAAAGFSSGWWSSTRMWRRGGQAIVGAVDLDGGRIRKGRGR